MPGNAGAAAPLSRHDKLNGRDAHRARTRHPSSKRKVCCTDPSANGASKSIWRRRLAQMRTGQGAVVEELEGEIALLKRLFEHWVQQTDRRSEGR